MKYRIKFDFTDDRKDDLKEGIWTTSVAKRIIKAEHNLEPCTENSGGDIRYETDNAEIAMALMELVFTVSEGGWWSIEPMKGVYHIYRRN